MSLTKRSPANLKLAKWARALMRVVLVSVDIVTWDEVVSDEGVG